MTKRGISESRDSQRELPGGPMSIESRTCEHVEALGGVDTPEERAAFLKWWEGQAHWSGSACAVAYQGWLARTKAGGEYAGENLRLVKAAEVILGLWSETELDPEDEDYEHFMAAFNESVTGYLAEVRAMLGSSVSARSGVCPACGGTDADPTDCAMDCPEPRPGTEAAMQPQPGGGSQ